MDEHSSPLLRRAHSAVRAIRGGLVRILPVLLIGSFALMLRSLPLPAYQRFLAAFLDGLLLEVLDAAYNATFGLLSVYMTAAISYQLAGQYPPGRGGPFAVSMTAVGCYGVLIGFLRADFPLSSLGVRGMFTAIFSAMVSSALYIALSRRMPEGRRSFSDGADEGFNSALSVLPVAVPILLLFALVNSAAVRLWGADSVHGLFTSALSALFSGQGRTFLTGLCYVLLSSALWFCGIHGSDVLEGVSDTLFVPAMELNRAAVAAGQAPTEILSKQFFDMFVLIGGCGSALCLLLALLIFSRRRSSRGLGKLAALPMVFNISELMVFGLPVILNPVMLAPFLLAPLSSYVLSYLAFDWGLVPIVATEVEWTTPILLGGYSATGSLAGSALQLLCLAAGVLIYAPFVRLLDRRKDAAARQYITELTDTLRRGEEDGRAVTLTALRGDLGAVARSLVYDVRHGLTAGLAQLHYQPQHDADGRCIGAEALLRWDHPSYGMLYPPLVIKIAKEGGLSLELEKAILSRAVADAEVLNARLPAPVKISVNISAQAISQPVMTDHLAVLSRSPEVRAGRVFIEITEQEAFASNDASVCEKVARLKELGYGLAIDDFSMGHTSIVYLQENSFDLVKLDGGLVRSLKANPRCREIISSIVFLSRSLGFTVCAEFVETEEQRRILADIGCTVYQGYLYSPALPREAFAAHAESNAAQEAEARA